MRSPQETGCTAADGHWGVPSVGWLVSDLHLWSGTGCPFLVRDVLGGNAWEPSFSRILTKTCIVCWFEVSHPSGEWTLLSGVMLIALP
jgi:hypothetical protein